MALRIVSKVVAQRRRDRTGEEARATLDPAGPVAAEIGVMEDANLNGVARGHDAGGLGRREDAVHRRAAPEASAPPEAVEDRGGGLAVPQRAVRPRRVLHAAGVGNGPVHDSASSRRRASTSRRISAA